VLNFLDTDGVWREDENKQWVVMQFTGLQDKNGKEIYEGDIVAGYPHGSVFIAWDDQYACFSCYWFYTNEGESVSEDFGLFAVQLESCKADWCVVGNIYENAELLEP